MVMIYTLLIILVITIALIVSGLRMASKIWNALYIRYQHILYQNVLGQLNLTPMIGADNFLDQFHLAPSSPLAKLTTKKIYQGTFAEQLIWVVYFDLIANEYYSRHYLGIAMASATQNHALQIYDSNSEFIPVLWEPKQTESVEFDKAYKIFSDDDKNHYYQLSPAAMSNLLNIRAEEGNPLNIQFSSDKVLFYAIEDSKPHWPKSKNQLIEVITQSPSFESINALKSRLEFKISKYNNMAKELCE